MFRIYRNTKPKIVNFFFEELRVEIIFEISQTYEELSQNNSS